MRSVLLSSFLLVATPAAAADQFDLICTAKKESQHYRVDLAKSEYCFGDCRQVMPIATITSGLIKFYDDEPKFPGDATKYNIVNRLTGEWQWYNYSPRLGPGAMDIKGTCEPAPFSGLGDAAQKF
jgi:hypothetical protein